MVSIHGRNHLCLVFLNLFIVLLLHKKLVDAIVTKSIQDLKKNLRKNNSNYWPREKYIENSRRLNMMEIVQQNENDDFEENDVVFPETSEEKTLSETIYVVKELSLYIRNYLTRKFRSQQYQQIAERYLWSKTTRAGLDIELSFAGRLFKDFSSRVQTIYPGTIWCGAGNTAANDAAIGLFHAVDNCCREHDKCPDSISARNKGHGLSNPGFFTRSHCDCDRDFYFCLKDANTFVARKIGVTYFNILRPQCFREEHPIVQCMKWFDNRCLTYIIDETRNATWQWFDNRYF